MCFLCLKGSSRRTKWLKVIVTFIQNPNARDFFKGTERSIFPSNMCGLRRSPAPHRSKLTIVMQCDHRDEGIYARSFPLKPWTWTETRDHGVIERPARYWNPIFLKDILIDCWRWIKVENQLKKHEVRSSNLVSKFIQVYWYLWGSSMFLKKKG